MIRFPAVADQFYPGDRASLTAALNGLCDKEIKEKKKALVVVSPHAGYVYSGGVAGETFSRVEIPEDVLVLGPNHHGHGVEVALMVTGSWSMPMKDVPMNTRLGKELTQCSAIIQEDELAHRYEHSLEVQVPFLQYFQENLSLAPIVVSHLSYDSCMEVGRDIARAIKAYDKPVLIVASTDMTHYESREAAKGKDKLAIERVLALDPVGLYQTVLGNRISMCGIMPTTIALIAAKELGAEKTELVRYTDSGEASGDTRQVVGYAGMIIT